MHCPVCHRAMVSTSSQIIEDEKGAMTITRWRCRPCHETTEEIWLSAGYRGPDPTRIRYAVTIAPWGSISSRQRLVPLPEEDLALMWAPSDSRARALA